MTITLQASLVYRPPPSSCSFRLHLPSRCSCSVSSNFFGAVSELNSYCSNLDSISLRSCICRRGGRLFVVNCALYQSGEFNLTSVPDKNGNIGIDDSFSSDELVSGGEDASAANAGNVTVVHAGKEAVKVDSAGGVIEAEELKSRLPILAFLVGFLAMVRKGVESAMSSEWLSWWPFWRQEKRLERLISEADANPKDASVQSALLAELNKHSYPPF